MITRTSCRTIPDTKPAWRVSAPSQAQRQATVDAFDKAETEFGRLADQNNALRKLIDSGGEGAIATLLGAAKEKGGDIRLLAQLKGSMRPDDFNQIGGMLLTELGHNNASGEFSLAQFQRNFDKVSDRAKSVLFKPEHLKNIEDIAEMGAHIKKALKESSSSHSNGMIVMLDVAKDAALIGADIATGGLAGLGGKTLIGAGTTVAMYTLARWLGNPAKASSMASWNRARLGMMNHPTPARLGVYNLATRNLANNLGIPAESVMHRLTVADPNGRGDEHHNPE
jgi:hypothetical protein